MKTSKELGTLVLNICKEKNISDTELAEYFGCEEEKIQDFLYGEAFFSYANFVKLSKLLDISIADLLG